MRPKLEEHIHPTTKKDGRKRYVEHWVEISTLTVMMMDFKKAGKCGALTCKAPPILPPHTPPPPPLLHSISVFQPNLFQFLKLWNFSKRKHTKDMCTYCETRGVFEHEQLTGAAQIHGKGRAPLPNQMNIRKSAKGGILFNPKIYCMSTFPDNEEI